MDVNDNLVYLYVIVFVIAAAIFVWLAYDSSSMAFIWAIMSYKYSG